MWREELPISTPRALACIHMIPKISDTNNFPPHTVFVSVGFTTQGFQKSLESMEAKVKSGKITGN